MSEWDLHKASFRGVSVMVDLGENRVSPVAMQRAQDRLERRIQVDRFAFRDGATVTDLGRNPLRITLRAVFYGPGYLEKWRDFLVRALLPAGPADLVHPIDGPIRAQFLRYDREAVHDRRNSLSIELQFIEAGLSELPFQSFEPATPAEALAPVEAASAEERGALRETLAKVLREVGDHVLAGAVASASIETPWGVAVAKIGVLSALRAIAENIDAFVRGSEIEAERNGTEPAEVNSG